MSEVFTAMDRMNELQVGENMNLEYKWKDNDISQLLRPRFIDILRVVNGIAKGFKNNVSKLSQSEIAMFCYCHFHLLFSVQCI